MTNNEDDKKKEAKKAYDDFMRMLAKATSEKAMEAIVADFERSDGELEVLMAQIGMACHGCLNDPKAGGIDLHIEGKPAVAVLENCIAFAMSMYRRTKKGNENETETPAGRAN